MKEIFSGRVLHYYIFLGLLALFTYIYIINAWVTDDAYITFRTIDNFIHGYGLTWNIQERVQVYSNPLWMFFISAFYAFTSEAFYTTIIVSFLLCILTFIVMCRFFLKGNENHYWKPSFFVLTLIASKAFIDYTSSGLENPLSYLLTILFCGIYIIRNKDFNRNNIFILVFIASLAFVNRADIIIIFLPAIVHAVWMGTKRYNWRVMSIVLYGFLPAILWLLFSMIYYGFPFPNSAYAKAFVNGIDFIDKLKRGIRYYRNSVFWDTLSHFVLLGSIVLSIRKKWSRSLMILSGVIIYIGYVVLVAASATHMSGRFFALPFFIACLLLTYHLDNVKIARYASVIIVIFLFVHPLSSIKMGTTFYRMPELFGTIPIDAKWYAYQEGAALLNYRPGKSLPDHAWYHEGERFRKNPVRVHLGGASESGFGEAIGYFGYAAGPEKFIIDYVGLGDPLLARLPVSNPVMWRPGHFYRVVPDGYIESVKEGRNLIKDRGLHLYYEKLLTITRGPLFTLQRFGDIVQMNLGGYKYLLETYTAEAKAKYMNQDYREILRRMSGPIQ
ncbi:MAG: hypothetical protein ABSB78_03540 [Bacteroidota bacterium]